MLGVDQREKSTSALNEKVLMQAPSVCLCLVKTMSTYLVLKLINGFTKVGCFLSHFKSLTCRPCRCSDHSKINFDTSHA